MAVLAQQVVEPVPVRGRLVEQMARQQRFQHAFRGGRAQVQRGGRRVHREVRAGVQTEPAERGALLRREGPVRQVEGPQQLLLGIPDLAQPSLGAGQAVGQRAERPGGMGAEAARDQFDREREMAA